MTPPVDGAGSRPPSGEADVVRWGRPLVVALTLGLLGAIAIARSNSNVIYAGTGEANNSSDSNFGRGILVSTDGANTSAGVQTSPAFEG